MCRRYHKSNNHLKGFSAFLMICIYLLAIFQTNGSYFHVHEHDVEISHNPELEKDACHRTIYHRDLNHGCKHPSHLTKENKRCTLCEGILILDKTSFEISVFYLNFHTSQEIYPYSSLSESILKSELKNKGPPFKGTSILI